MFHRAFGLCVVLLAMLAGPGAQAQLSTCDFAGFDNPCEVEGGAYRALVPEGRGPFPALVYLYGSGGQSTRIAEHPLFKAAVVERGYALIVPVARNMEYRKGVIATGWNLRHEPGRGRDDALFVDRVINDAQRRFELDADRILLAGQSRGAFLIWEIACHESQTATAYAVHGGGYLGKMPADCGQPVRFLHTHGVQDTTVPYLGAPIVSGGVAMMPVTDSLKVMARTNGCAEEPIEDGLNAGLVRMTWENCQTGSALDLMLHEGGHGIPLEWFRATLDWFEEPPKARPEITPRTVTLGTRIEGQFKGTPRTGSLLGGSRSETSGSVQRLRPPSKKVSE